MNRFIARLLSLAAGATTTGCMSPPQDLDLALTRPSIQRQYVVTLLPPDKPAAINQLHEWQVKLGTATACPRNRR